MKPAPPMSPKQHIESVIHKMDPNLKQTDPAWVPACFLGAALMIGPDAAAIADTLEADPIYAGVLAERARQCGAWPPTPERYDGEDGGIQFWMDVSVLDGTIQTADGGKTYSLSADGKRQVERLLKP